jgi:hypothetical protein
MRDPVPEDRLPPMPTASTRWRATALSFGPVGKIALTIGVVLGGVVAVILSPFGGAPAGGAVRGVVRGVRAIWRPRYEDG